MSEASDVHKDLAFMKSLVSEGPRMQAASGMMFLVAGLAYGGASLIYAAQTAWQFNMPGFVWLALSIAPTAIFFIAMFYVMWRDRKVSQHGIATRAVNAAYGSAGLANLAIAITYGYVATSEKSMLIWLLYPVAMCAFQGSVWYVAWMIRRKVWLGLVSIGWFVTTLALGFLIHQTATYLLILGVALVVIMGGSGYAMMRQAKA